jgi:hypothetical protein
MKAQQDQIQISISNRWVKPPFRRGATKPLFSIKIIMRNDAVRRLTAWSSIFVDYNEATVPIGAQNERSKSSRQSQSRSVANAANWRQWAARALAFLNPWKHHKVA